VSKRIRILQAADSVHPSGQNDKQLDRLWRGRDDVLMLIVDRRRWPLRVGAIGMIALSAVLSACGADGPDTSGTEVAAAVAGDQIATAPPDPALVERGRELVTSSGCAACHGVDGGGGIGPSWVGLAGSDVELVDGTTVVADESFLRRSILEPEAQLVAGYGVVMPRNGLDPDQVDAVIAFIVSLRP